MIDLELLELAAKAAGVGDIDLAGRPCVLVIRDGGIYTRVWDPLTDDGDALRLATALHLSMDLFDDEIKVGYTPNCNSCDQVTKNPGGNIYAATRRAIVRAAAEIGRSMK